MGKKCFVGAECPREYLQAVLREVCMTTERMLAGLARVWAVA